MITNVLSAKEAAKNYKKHLDNLGVKIKLSECLELVAHLNGYKNWCAYEDSLSKSKIFKRDSDFFMKRVLDQMGYKHAEALEQCIEERISKNSFERFVIQHSIYGCQGAVEDEGIAKNDLNINSPLSALDLILDDDPDDRSDSVYFMIEGKYYFCLGDDISLADKFRVIDYDVYHDELNFEKHFNFLKKRLNYTDKKIPNIVKNDKYYGPYVRILPNNFASATTFNIASLCLEFDLYHVDVEKISVTTTYEKFCAYRELSTDADYIYDLINTSEQELIKEFSKTPLKNHVGYKQGVNSWIVD